MEHWERRPTAVPDVSQEVEGAVGTTGDGMSREEDNRPIELVLHLPRYSWVTLGRILMRASREGVSYGRSMPGAVHHVWSTVSMWPLGGKGAIV